MRILMACAAFPPFADGGGPISALITAKLLQDQGHDLQVLNVADVPGDERFDGIPVKRLKTLNIYWNYRLPHPAWQKALWHALENGNPRAFVRMRREIKAFKPDVVLTDSIENINVATWLAAKSLSIPVCHIVRSTFLICWRGSMRRDGHNCERQCRDCKATSVGKRLSSQVVSGVIGETDFIVRRHIQEGYFGNAVRNVVPGAILNPPTTTRTPGRREGAPLRVGFIGAHDETKGLTTLATAFKGLADDNVELLVAGAGTSPFAKTVPSLFAGTRTTFLGWIKPEDFFPQIDILVVPSLFEEPFGRVVIEAFSQSVPVIASRIGGLAEIVEDGRDGRSFAPGDHAALRSIIQDLAGSPEMVARLSEGALSSSKRYTIDVVGRQLTSAISAALT